MSKILVKIISNYADEFDVDGFSIHSLEDWKEIKKALYDRPWPAEIHFGSNEFVEFESEEEVLRNIEVKTISDTAAQTLIGTLGLNAYYPSYGLINIGDIAEW